MIGEEIGDAFSVRDSRGEKVADIFPVGSTVTAESVKVIAMKKNLSRAAAGAVETGYL